MANTSRSVRGGRPDRDHAWTTPYGLATTSKYATTRNGRGAGNIAVVVDEEHPQVGMGLIMSFALPGGRPMVSP